MKDILYKILGKSYSAETPSGPELPSSTLSKYNIARGKSSGAHICYAPFSNMYFNVHGDCAPCWLTFLEPDSYPAKSIHDIWFGEKYQSIRNHLLKHDLTYKCNVCLKNLQGGNFTSVLARAYDIYEPSDYPAMMELELSNKCNLECVMCIGELSSSIRKNREKLPPMKESYDDNFINQLEEFIPHLKELRLNGGEPFLINAVYKIFEKVDRLNPKLKIVIATNGTVMNYKVKEWLEKLNIHINFSLDSLTPEIYETIRVNAHFDRVMEHFHFYRNYTKATTRTLCLMVNPMRNNWHELPEFVRFANKHHCNIWFNTVHRPVEWSIWALPHAEIKKIYEWLNTVRFSSEDRSSPIAAYNLGIYKSLVSVQINNWLADAIGRENIAQAKDWVVTESEAKELFQKKMTEYIYTRLNEGEEQKKYRLKNLFIKTDQLTSLLEKQHGTIEFYKNIWQSPAEIFYHQLEKRSVADLANEFVNRFIK